MSIRIRIYQEDKIKFSIHPGEEHAAQIANLLHSKDFCRITEMLTRAMGHSTGSGHSFEAHGTKWSGLVAGYIVDESVTVKDIAELLSKEFNAPLHVITENEEYLITNDEDGIF